MHAIGVKYGKSVTSAPYGFAEGEQGSKVGGLPYEGNLFQFYVGEVVVEVVEGVPKESSSVFGS